MSFNTVGEFRNCIEVYKSISAAEITTYYSRIILYSFSNLLFSELCQHNPSRPSSGWIINAPYISLIYYIMYYSVGYDNGGYSVSPLLTSLGSRPSPLTRFNYAWAEKVFRPRIIKTRTAGRPGTEANSLTLKPKIPRRVCVSKYRARNVLKITSTSMERLDLRVSYTTWKNRRARAVTVSISQLQISDTKLGSALDISAHFDA